MSLYADEDLSTVQEIESAITTSAPSDPLQALAAALTCTAESTAQAEALVAAGQRFEEHPERLPELCGQLLPMVVDGGESLLRTWTLDMVALAVGRSGLRVDVKMAGMSNACANIVMRYQH
jgi:symplekin